MKSKAWFNFDFYYKISIYYVKYYKMNWISFVNIKLEFLDDTKEYYASTDFVNWAHAVGSTPQEAINNLVEILPDLIQLQKKSWLNLITTDLYWKLSFNFPIMLNAQTA